MRVPLAIAALLPLLSLTTAQSTSNLTTSDKSLRDVLTAQTNLTQFTNLLEAQLPTVLKTLDTYDAKSNPITILAPNDHAFENIMYNDALSNIFANNYTADLANVIGYHSVPGSWTAESLNTSFKFLPTMTQSTNFTTVTGGQRVGAVLQPPGNDTFYQWLMVFTSGEGTRSVVTVQDVPFKGGYIQIIDNFLIPPEPLVETSATYALSNPPFAISSFVGAVYSANKTDLAKRLNETKDITMFVPANVAMAAVASTLKGYSDASNTTTWADLLEYHIVVSDNGPIYSDMFTNASSIRTLNNKMVEMRFYPNSYFVNSARIIYSDIFLSNGVVHIIDGVLSPDHTAEIPNPTSATQPPVLAAETGSVNGSLTLFSTWVPDYVPTDTPTSTADIALNQASSASSSFASATATKKSDATRVRTSNTWIEMFGICCTLCWTSAAMFMAL